MNNIKTLSQEDISQFDDTADVIVVGYGIAGACAALEARRAGGDTLVIERASAGGGASALSSGIFYLGGGTEVQHACGYEDDADNMYRFMTASMGTEDADMLRLYCDNSVSHFDWLEAQGVPFERTAFRDKAVFLLTTEGLMSTGNEKVWPYREIARPVPRGHQVCEEGESPGGLAMKALLSKCEEEGVRASYDSRVTALITDKTGKVCGVRLRKAGQDLDFKAEKAVILTTGGFAMNAEMTSKYLPLLSETTEALGTPYTDGTGIMLGASAGGALRAMDGMIATASIYPPGQLIKGIIVNKRGKRFVAEDSYHGRTASFITEQPDQTAYLIVDSEIFAYPEIVTANHRLVDGFETIEEMEAGLHLPQGSLVQTMADYNQAARQGRDPLFEKHSEWIKPLDQGPWAAFDISFTHSIYLYMTLGGLQINSNAQVVDRNGNAVAGLYAAGACAAHIPKSGKSYASGMSLGPGSFFGRMAGRHAVKSFP